MKYYTMIGSRSTPKEVYDIMVKVAAKLKSQGWIVRSGGADGADSAAEDGCNYECMNIYLPWDGFNGRKSINRGYIDATKLKTYNQAQKMAEETHPAWERCSRGAKGLHTRNVYQVLGNDLNTPSGFVICWAEVSGNKGHVKGGTATAVSLALKNNIPVINLYTNDGLKRAMKFLED